MIGPAHSPGRCCHPCDSAVFEHCAHSVRLPIVLATAANLLACPPLQTEDGRKEARVVVDSEEEPLRVLLETRIHKEDGFQKQQGMSRLETAGAASQSKTLTRPAETLIVWTEPQTQVDMALSFQEADGCAQIWFVTTTCAVTSRQVVNDTDVSPLHRKFVNDVQRSMTGDLDGPGTPSSLVLPYIRILLLTRM